MIEELLGDVEVEVEEVKELKFEGVELGDGDTSDHGVVGVVVEEVVGELAGDNEAGHEETVDVEGVEKVRGVALDETVDVDEGHDEKVFVATSILCDALDVSVNLDVWGSHCMEDGDVLVGQLVVLSDDFVEDL